MQPRHTVAQYFAKKTNRSAHTQEIETLGGCQPLFISNAQSSKLIQLCDGSFQYPAPTTKAAAINCCASRAKVEYDGPASAVGLLVHRKRGLRARSQDTCGPSLSPLERRDAIHKGHRLLRVVAVRPGEPEARGTPGGVTNQGTLAARLGAVGRIRSRFWAEGGMDDIEPGLLKLVTNSSPKPRCF